LSTPKPLSKQLISVLGITRKSAYQRAARGQIPHRKWGRKLIFKRAEIVAFLDQLPGPRPEDVRKRWGLEPIRKPHFWVLSV
jgi:predicted DNA-binding transcriptional regulator AlpA